MKYSLAGMLGLGRKPKEEAPKLRARDPKTPAQAAIQQRQQAEGLDLVREIERLAAKLQAIATPALPAEPPAAPLPVIPPGAPPPPTLQWNARTKEWVIPTTLSAAELASTVPSKEAARRFRLAMEAREAALEAKYPARPQYDPQSGVPWAVVHPKRQREIEDEIDKKRAELGLPQVARYRPPTGPSGGDMALAQHRHNMAISPSYRAEHSGGPGGDGWL
jgi:hypothetical protein